VIGGIVGGWLANELDLGRVQGFLGALVFATIGAMIVRVVLRAIER
jgi:uncharacterized membrane protein YeaQ/YmgE (transglycosylase-associated protein family)